jgi:hypothetical protein
MSSRWFRCAATLLLLTLGFGIPAQAKSSAAGAASLRQGGVLDELTAFGVAFFLRFKEDPKCGTGYCPTPPGPPPPGHTISIMVSGPRPVGKGSLP